MEKIDINKLVDMLRGRAHLYQWQDPILAKVCSDAADVIEKLFQENAKLGCFNVMNQEAIKMAHERIQELEEQLNEYHKFDGFLAVHGMLEIEEKTDG